MKFKQIAIRALIGLFVIFILMVAWFSKDLPTPAKIDAAINIPSTQILDRNGKLLYAVSGDKKRFVIPYNEMPDNVKHATIALEDKNFYRHFGIDFKGIMRSIVVDVFSGSRSQGGSTITQQFVKNALLTSNKSFTRKIKEAILAVEIDAIYPKDKVLELYLNEIPYGSTSYGIEAASRAYFNKSAKDLTLAEAATMAAIPQRPSYYSPYGPNKDSLLKRKDLALDLMAEQNYITKEEAEAAKKQEIVFQPRRESITAPHFVFYVQEVVADKYGEEALQNNGLKIYTTLDLDVQHMAEEAIEHNTKTLDRYNAKNAALVSVDPKTGQILAMVGSRDYFNRDIQGQVNVTTSNRQPGSSFKPIVYATGFKGKYNPAYPLFDLKTDFGGGYTPSNYNGNTMGPVSIRTALSNSLNIPAVKMLSLVGINEALDTAKDLGISTLTDTDRYGLSLVLGAGEVKPVEMAGAFGVFGNEGKYNPQTPILKIESKDGKVLEEFKEPTNKQVLDSQAAYLMSNVLSDNNARKIVFGFTKALTIPGRTVAVKTGTTQSNHDAWTVGYTPQISTAVWVGNTDNKEMKTGADGSIVAAPIWNEFMTKYLSDKPKEEFIRPEGIQEAKVDFLSNKLLSEYSPADQNRTDLFASWNAPKEKDDIHIVVKINKANGKLATDKTPAALIEDRLFTNIHSERPDNPSWENPVRAWAQSQGIANLPPKDSDDSYQELNRYPAASITSPTNGATVSGTFTVSADARADYGVKNVTFKINDTTLGSASQSPYSITADSAQFSPGTYQIKAIVTDANDVSSTSEAVTITITSSASNDTTAPVISGIDVKTSANSATVSWNTDEPANGYIEYGPTAALGFTSIKNTSYTTSNSITVGGLLSNTTYYYRIISEDKKANRSTSTTSTFTTK